MANRMRGWRSERVKQLITEIGPTVTYDDVARHLREEGTKCCRETFARALKDVFPVEPVVVAVEKVQSAAPDLLSSFAHFAHAVERVGGVQKARLLLDHIEKLWEVMR